MSRASRSDGEGDDDATLARLVDVDLTLSELITLTERVDWRDVPGISSAEAAAWNARLVDAREDVLNRVPDAEEGGGR
ncbi:hypothetical protein EFA46_015945 (plasmid) [Halarchaeum sp. CBA1220]|uniref:hypothetical protein n=1 Tax=Halarchaeum sp. CBA1220 TaxID=1853682 RepID=UPI00131441FE|nr:hypothetical protein [Halarchaeum sp. CBA1220]QLC35749.1 hypothetical protein EFA46_015945 [Halarchaeum sp. CBA1220]